MTNKEISQLFFHVAAAYSIKDEKKYRFQIIAYQKAADAIGNASHEIQELYKENKLNTVQGIGPSIKSYIEELITTGKVKHFDTIFEGIPPALFPLLDIPSFGPKKAYKLVSHFQLTNPDTVLEELTQLAKENKIAPLAGFGEKSQSDIIRAIEEYGQGQGKLKTTRMVLPYANELARKMISYLEQCPEVQQASTLGSLRRKRETIGDIDIAVASNDPKAVFDHFTSYPHMKRLIERGEKSSSIITASGKQIDLMVQPPEAFGSLLQHFTGSKAHNVHLREYALSRGLSLSEYGIKRKSDNQLMTYQTEESFYEALGLQWIPPEMREDLGEIELAQQRKLPKLVELSDIKGDFHLHSSYPIEPSHDMGRNSMEEMIEVAEKRGYTHLGFSEHNPSISKHTKEQTKQILIKRKEFIANLNLKFKKDIRVFSLLETDILPSGKLAIDDELLALLDATIVSIHSGFSMDKDTMTERVLKGLSHPKAKILAHPTGRLLNKRSGYQLDWERVFTYCKEHHKALEINAFPDRLDLPDTLAREAIKHGVKLIIDTDSHESGHMALMEYGVSVARRAWATKDDILNTLPYNKFEEWIKARGGE